MALEPDFVADSPYGPGGLLLDDILEVDRERGLVVARMPTPADLPLTREQRTEPAQAPRAPERRAPGPHERDARLRPRLLRPRPAAPGRLDWIRSPDRLGAVPRPGAARGAARPAGLVHPMLRRGRERILARYRFEFEQGVALVYEGRPERDVAAHRESGLIVPLAGGFTRGPPVRGGPVWAQDAPAGRLLGCFL